MVDVYSSTDESAPVLNKDKFSLNAVLKAVLTQGYGSKQAAGWVLEFEDTENDICCFRNGNLGYYLRIAYEGEGISSVKSYESMTDASTGTNPSDARYVNYNVNLSSIPWVIVANNRCFYLYIAGNHLLYFFGEFPSFIAGELWNFGISTDDLRRYNKHIDAIRLSTGEQQHTILNIAANPFGSEYFGGEDNTVRYPYNGAIFTTKPILFEESQPRGMLPGFTDFKHKKDDIVTSLGITDGWLLKTVEGIQYIFFDVPYGVVAIDLNNFWSLS